MNFEFDDESTEAGEYRVRVDGTIKGNSDSECRLPSSDCRLGVV
jgi:hypothetical protein